jgi:DNA-binding IclR family transcriptional regulator
MRLSFNVYRHIDLQVFLEIINNNPEPLTTQRIAKLAGCSWNTAERWLSVLERTGKLTHETSSGPKGQFHLWRLAGERNVRMVEAKAQS